MSELDYEEAPALEVNEPRVRNWLTPELRAWKRGCYPPRHGFMLVWGVFILPWALWQALKFFIYAAGVVLMVLAYVVWIVAELITYRSRRRRTLLRMWTGYMLELHDEDPPATAA